jgi:malate synthase
MSTQAKEVRLAGIEVHAPPVPAQPEILTPSALEFLADLEHRFGARRRELLAARAKRQREFDAGALPGFLPETRHIRDGDWTVAPIPEEIADRRVEITGPVDRKMVINALNSGANVFMADFEDSLTPAWSNLIEGQACLRDANRRTIAYTSPEGKNYRLGEKVAIIMARPRGWHLPEKHVLVDGQPMSGSLFDFGLYFFHNAKKLLARDSRPYFYLPKMESHLEARLWNDVFNFAQDATGTPRGSIRATVLIETLPAAFEMDEILYELRTHSAGLNCGRWDYLFSCIKKLRRHPDFILADRARITMTQPFLRAYTLLAIKTCHRRNVFAMGGMAAQIPIKNDPEANEAALAKVRADKEREATDGHDGTWVAHPGLVPIAREIFDSHMPSPNQINRRRDDVDVTAKDLLAFGPATPITESGLRTNIEVAIEYLGSWLAGQGCVPIHNLMEDAATAEISRAQAWHWVRSPKGVLDDGRKVTMDLVRALIPQELARVRQNVGESAFAAGAYPQAATLFEELTASEGFSEFLTLPAYERIA